MPDVSYHGWTHRPKSQGGTDPIEFPTSLPVAYATSSGFTAADGSYYSLGMVTGTDPDEFGAADSISVYNVEADGSLREGSSLVLHDNGTDERGLQLFGSHMVAIHGFVEFSGGVFGSGVSAEIYTNVGTVGVQANEYTTFNWAFPVLCFTAVMPVVRPLWDEFTTALWPSNRFGVTMIALGDDLVVNRARMGVCLLAPLDAPVTTT